MMTNLFSMFDPSNFLSKTAWIIPTMFILMPPIISSSKFNTMTKKMMNSLKMEFHQITTSNTSNIMLLPMFLTIVSFNIISMVPSSFPITAQMSIILPLSFSLWTTSMVYFMIKKTNKFLSHLVPSGSPYYLMPMMVMIEMTSNLIRPITLSVRLMANITAGHLLMHLLSSFSCSMPFMLNITLMLPMTMILSSLELAVAFIQSYILCTLIALYSSEIN